MSSQDKKYHRGRRGSRKRKGSGSGKMVSNIILAVAVIVFCVSFFQLFRIIKGYYDGRSEYDDIRELAIEETEKDDGGTGYQVDFDELMKINPDTIGWIRFDPEPSVISYPIVQGKDNDLYLHKTFSANENTLGAIFLNAYNSEDFSDKNSIIYGHRMKDGSMFRHLQDYEDQSFWEENQYFYIYTPEDGEIRYHIYAAGTIEDTSDVYLTYFGNEGQYQSFLNLTKEISLYDTGVEVTTADTIVTLSTCTSASDNHRFVVLGVRDEGGAGE